MLRDKTPNFLKDNYKKWGRQFANLKSNNFQWATYQNIKVNKLLEPLLLKLTNEHCSFCDGFPFDMSLETIEHFRPKSKYKKLSYVWHNLFICCDKCQSAKGEKFDKKLLKPDRDNYEFNKYFIVDYKTGELKFNPKVNLENQEKAKITIKFYALSDEVRNKSRIRERKRFMKLLDIEQKEEINDFSYRYFLE